LFPVSCEIDAPILLKIKYSLLFSLKYQLKGGVVEAQIAKLTGSLTELSKQQLVDCANDNPRRCELGGNSNYGWRILSCSFASLLMVRARVGTDEKLPTRRGDFFIFFTLPHFQKSGNSFEKR
jgi:hypothetical protein